MKAGPILKKCIKWVAGAALIFGMALLIPAQNQKAKLQERKSKLEQEINNTNKQLSQTQKNKEANLNQLFLINKKINHREDLIHAIGEEVNGLDHQIGTLNDTIFRLSTSLGNLKKEYALLIYSTYKNRNAYSRLMFIFSSTNFNQAYKRLKYLQQYSDYRKSQANAILKTQSLLGNKKLELEKQKSSKLTLKERQELEKNQLASEKLEKDKAIKKLTKQEKTLLVKLKEKEAALSKLQRAIEAVIAEEIRKANEEKARKAAETPVASKPNEAVKKGSGGKSSTEVKPATTPKSSPVASSNRMSSNVEEIALSNSFSGNKGRLPWPVERGTIASSFGEHPHPEFKNIKIRNNGIDISTAAGSKARVVFDGVVSSVMSITNLHYVVIIRHGDFLTVYSNLQDVAVKKGDKVKTRQVIGTIFTDPDVNKTLLHFELWNGTALQNPGLWLGN
jgi:septal ring factor EnvC (AmiA/AmiB activator)